MYNSSVLAIVYYFLCTLLMTLISKISLILLTINESKLTIYISAYYCTGFPFLLDYVKYSGLHNQVAYNN
jgi:hypothetical protein